MNAVLLSEVRKLTTTRSWIVLLGVTAAAALVFAGIYVVVGLVGGTMDPPSHMFRDPGYVATIYTSGKAPARIPGTAWLSASSQRLSASWPWH